MVIRPNLYEANRSIIRGEPYLCLEGKLQLHSGTLNLIATSATPLAQVPRILLPQPPLRHPYPGNPHDPREVIPGSEPAPAHTFAALELATPASHNFH